MKRQVQRHALRRSISIPDAEWDALGDLSELFGDNGNRSRTLRKLIRSAADEHGIEVADETAARAGTREAR